jgi:hypothetical protein
MGENSVPWPSGKARVCKTLIPRFKSGRHLQPGLVSSGHSGLTDHALSKP